MIPRLLPRLLAALGAILILLSQRSPWMQVPIDVVHDDRGAARCVSGQPGATPAFRAGSLATGLLLAVGLLRHRRTGPRGARVAAGLAAVLATYPFAAMTLDATLSAEAAWLTIQHENLVWLGGDLHTNMEAGRSARKEHVAVVDTPRQVSVVPMPSSRLGAFRFGRLLAWLEAFGYSNRFCQFVGRGWIMAVAGALLLLAAGCMPEGTLDRGRVVGALAAAGMVLGTCAAAGVVTILLATRDLDRARGAIALGRHDVGMRHLERAGDRFPALREDTGFVAQAGLVAHRLGRGRSLAGRLYRANLLERQGRYAQALDLYDGLATDAPPRSAIRREAVRALLRAGIHALNGNRTGVAVTHLEEVLRVEPCNVKANYALQLAYLRTGRRADLERLVERLRAVYRCFQMPTKAIVLASSHENCLLAASRDGDLAAVVRHAAKARRP